MKTIVISRQKFLVQQELAGAFRALPDARVVELSVPNLPSADTARKACAALSGHDLSLFVTLNDWGLDSSGVMAEYLEKRGAVHMNWYVDDPAYAGIMYGINHVPKKNRLDVVSDRGYAGPLAKRGFRPFFLPLATDPSIFFPQQGIAPVRDLCFVGNSYLEATYKSIEGLDEFFTGLAPFIHGLVKNCLDNADIAIEKAVEEELGRRALPQGLNRQKAVYLVKHFAGYLHRKKLVLDCAAAYPDFMVFGDAGWGIDLPIGRVSGAVGYYKNLSETYQQTKISVDINRIVVRDGFTQRVFDCLAAGGFVITSYKKVVEEFFKTSGPGQEIVMFSNEKELRDKIDYFLAHDGERKEIAARGREQILAEHTYKNRVDEIIKIVGREFGKL
jgi:spore maturation protein CgeB